MVRWGKHVNPIVFINFTHYNADIKILCVRTVRSEPEQSDHCVPSVIRHSFCFLPNQKKNLDLSYKIDLDLWDCLRNVKTHIIAKYHRTDLVICYCTHSREGKTPSYSQINVVG